MLLVGLNRKKKPFCVRDVAPDDPCGRTSRAPVVRLRATRKSLAPRRLKPVVWNAGEWKNQGLKLICLLFAYYIIIIYIYCILIV